MNRREFITNLSTLAVTIALPLKILESTKDKILLLKHTRIDKRSIRYEAVLIHWSKLKKGMIFNHLPKWDSKIGWYGAHGDTYYIATTDSFRLKDGTWTVRCRDYLQSQ